MTEATKYFGKVFTERSNEVDGGLPYPIVWGSLDKPEGVVVVRPHRECRCDLVRWEFPDGSALVNKHSNWGIGHPKGSEGDLYEIVSLCDGVDEHGDEYVDY